MQKKRFKLKRICHNMKITLKNTQKIINFGIQKIIDSSNPKQNRKKSMLKIEPQPENGGIYKIQNVPDISDTQTSNAHEDHPMKKTEFSSKGRYRLTYIITCFYSDDPRPQGKPAQNRVRV